MLSSNASELSATRQGTAGLFDELAAKYDQTIPFFRDFGLQLVEWATPAESNRVLDVACGRGAISMHAAKWGCEVVAIDASKAMIRALSMEAPEIAASVMDLHSLDFPDKAFDLVYCGFAMHLLTDPLKAAGEVWRVLTPGGRFAFSRPAPCPGSERWDFVHQLQHEFLAEAPGYQTISNGLSGPEILASFTTYTGKVAEVHIDLPNPETYWNWACSHGSWAFISALMHDAREEFRRRLLDRASQIDPLTLVQGAQFWLATK